MAPTLKPALTRRERRRSERRARWRALAASTLATGIAVLIGVSGAGGTYAWLTANGAAPGATVRSGTLTLLINDSTSAALGNWAVAPTAPQAKAFKVTNTGHAPAKLTGKVIATTTPGIAAYATARITQVGSSAACTTGLGGTQGALNGYTTATGFDTIAAGASRWYCLEVGIAANSPATVSGQSLNFTLTIDGTQDGS